MTAGFVARISPARMFVPIAATIFHVAIGAWLTTRLNSTSQTIGWFIITFFGTLTVFLGRLTLDKREQIRVDRDGIYARRWSKRTVPWSAIAGVEQRDDEDHKFLSITVKSAAEWQRPSLLSRLADLEPKPGPRKVKLDVAGMDHSFDELVTAVDTFLAAAMARTAPAQ